MSDKSSSESNENSCEEELCEDFHSLSMDKDNNEKKPEKKEKDGDKKKKTDDDDPKGQQKTLKLSLKKKVQMPTSTNKTPKQSFTTSTSTSPSEQEPNRARGVGGRVTNQSNDIKKRLQKNNPRYTSTTSKISSTTQDSILASPVSPTNQPQAASNAAAPNASSAQIASSPSTPRASYTPPPPSYGFIDEYIPENDKKIRIKKEPPSTTKPAVKVKPQQREDSNQHHHQTGQTIPQQTPQMQPPGNQTNPRQLQLLPQHSGSQILQQRPPPYQQQGTAMHQGYPIYNTPQEFYNSPHYQTPNFYMNQQHQQRGMPYQFGYSIDMNQSFLPTQNNSNSQGGGAGNSSGGQGRGTGIPSGDPGSSSDGQGGGTGSHSGGGEPSLNGQAGGAGSSSSLGGRSSTTIGGAWDTSTGAGTSTAQGSSFQTGASTTQGTSFQVGASTAQGSSFQTGASTTQGTSFQAGASTTPGSSFQTAGQNEEPDLLSEAVTLSEAMNIDWTDVNPPEGYSGEPNGETPDLEIIGEVMVNQIVPRRRGPERGRGGRPRLEHNRHKGNRITPYSRPAQIENQSSSVMEFLQNLTLKVENLAATVEKNAKQSSSAGQKKGGKFKTKSAREDPNAKNVAGPSTPPFVNPGAREIPILVVCDQFKEIYRAEMELELGYRHGTDEIGRSAIPEELFMVKPIQEQFVNDAMEELGAKIFKGSRVFATEYTEEYPYKLSRTILYTDKKK